MSNWKIERTHKPEKVNVYDVTLQDLDGARLSNLGIYRPLENTWEILIDKQNYVDCKVVAWKERPEVYAGKI